MNKYITAALFLLAMSQAHALKDCTIVDVNVSTNEAVEARLDAISSMLIEAKAQAATTELKRAQILEYCLQRYIGKILTNDNSILSCVAELSKVTESVP